MRLSVLAAAISFSIGLSMAADSQAAVRKRTEIAEQGLGPALHFLAKDRDLQIVYVSEDVNDLRTQGAAGELTPEEALTLLLRETGLKFQYLDEKTITIYRADAVSTELPDTGAHNNRSFWSRMRLARLEQSSSDTERASVGADAKAAASSLETVQVTGSRLNRAATEGAQPLLMFNREEIQRSGRSSITEFLRTLPEVSNSGVVEAPNGAYPHAATVQLRGLPAGRTLVLINGRRVPSSGSVDGGFANLNTIPAAAVERIDVLPQGASAVYGSDALAGVINIILRRDFDGIAVDARVGGADGTSDRRASAVIGKTWERGSASLVMDYYDRTPLYKSERDLTRDADYRRYGWRDMRSTVCNPGTVYSTTAANLPGVGATSAVVPGANASAADYAATAGQVNRCENAYNNIGLIYPAERFGTLGMAELRIGDSTTAFAEASYSKLHHEYTYGFTLSRALVPAANPYNPFGVPVAVDYRFSPDALPMSVSDIDTEFSRLLLGVRGELSGDWQWETSAWAARDHTWFNYRIPDEYFASPALSSTDPATALNLFTTGLPASREVLDAYRNSPGATFTVAGDGKFTTLGGSGLLRGSVLDLPAGKLSVAFGAEYVKEQYSNVGSRGLFDINRNAKAVYGELRAPLLAGDGGREVLAASAALRRDEYSDFGVATTPQYGIEWRPTRTLLLRAAYAEAFRAPDLYAVHGPTLSGAGITVIDPARNNEVRSGTYVAGGNPDLDAEQGRSVSAGLVWSSEVVSGLSTSLSWWRISMSERIALFPNPQLIVNNEGLFPNRVSRGAPTGDGLPGPITQIDYSALNLGNIWVEGVDLGIDYRWQTSLGTWSPNLRTTRYTRYDALLNPTIGTADYLGAANIDIWVPKWRGALGLNWRLNAWSAGVTGRYVGGYRDYNPLTSGVYQQLGDYWTVDLNARWDIGESLHLGRSWLEKSHIAAGVVNATDRLPSFSATTTPGFGYDAGQYDIRGRYAYLELGLKF